MLAHKDLKGPDDMLGVLLVILDFMSYYLIMELGNMVANVIDRSERSRVTYCVACLHYILMTF